MINAFCIEFEVLRIVVALKPDVQNDANAETQHDFLSCSYQTSLTSYR